MASVREFTVAVGYGSIACKKWVWGGDSPSTERYLAIHGWLDNAGSFDPLMEHFVTRDRCVVSIDLPGHGFSTNLPRGVPYSMNIDVQAMRSVILHLQWRRYRLIGHSMGGTRVHSYAMSWPEEIEYIINFDGTCIPLDFGVKDANPYANFAKNIDGLIGKGYTGKHKARTWQELYDRWMQVMPGVTPQDFSTLMKRGCIKRADGLYLVSTDANLRYSIEALFMYSQDTVFRAMQRLVTVPQLLIKTNNDVMKFESEEQTMMAKGYLYKLGQAYPNKFKIVIFEGAHHFHMQNPVKVTKLVDEFLAEHNSQFSCKL